MDTLKNWLSLAGKYRYVLIVVVAGLALMLLPQRAESADPTQQTIIQPQSTLQEDLEDILSGIQGVGKVQVLLTEAQGSRTVYVQDESASQDSLKTDAVIITDSSRTETGLISQVLPPVYLGAVVVCQGGDDPVVKLSVVEATCDATGLTADKITVLKMK